MVEADLQKMKPKLSNGPNPNPCHTTLHMGVKEAERGGLPLLDLPSYISECLTLAACLKLASSRVPCTYGPFSLFFRAPEVSVKVHLCHISALWMRETVGEGKSLGNLLPPPSSPPYSLGGVGIGWSVPARVFGSFVGGLNGSAFVPSNCWERVRGRKLTSLHPWLLFYVVPCESVFYSRDLK